MKFRVERTSECLINKLTPPCENAKLEKYNLADVRRYYTSFEDFDIKFGKCQGTWLSSGVNHCINKDGNIQREFEYEGWFIEVNTLEELMEFQNKYGEIIIYKDDYDDTGVYVNVIEIYDDYRE